VHTVLLPTLKQNLQSHTNSQHSSTAGNAGVDHLTATDRIERRHYAPKSPYSRNDKAISIERFVTVTGEGDRGTSVLECLDSRVHIA
jgi:hypothetical protein